MTTLKQLQALVDAGDKATYEPISLTTYSNYHGYSICTEYGDCIAERWENDPSDERLEKLLSFGNFAVIAANSRPAIKAAIAEIEAKDKALQIIAYGDLSHTDGLLGAIDYLRLTAKQALGACETTERSEDNDV